MPKKFIGINVHEAAKERISYAFDNFEKICISYSGGKDSTAMLHMVMDEAIKRKRKVYVMFIDLEAQFNLTINHLIECFDMYIDHIEPLWFCLPIQLRNAVSVFQPHWYPWAHENKQAWVRKLPKYAIHDENYLPFFCRGIEFEEFLPEFAKWLSKGIPTAFFVGIRTGESYNRYMAIQHKTKSMFRNKCYTTGITKNSYNFYPIFDWKTEDIWIYHGKNPHKPYNKLYDLMYKAGLSIHQQRICQPYGDDQRRGLWLYQVIEPETWGRVVARVNGANNGAFYMMESGNVSGYRGVSKPENHNWESFAKMLVNSMPDKTKEHYENKITIFVKWWMERGYEDGIPDEGDYKLEIDKKIPSWRRICKSLLRNDWWCKGIGFVQQKSAAYENYLRIMRARKEKWQMNLFN